MPPVCRRCSRQGTDVPSAVFAQDAAGETVVEGTAAADRRRQQRPVDLADDARLGRLNPAAWRRRLRAAREAELPAWVGPTPGGPTRALPPSTALPTTDAPPMLGLVPRPNYGARPAQLPALDLVLDPGQHRTRTFNRHRRSHCASTTVCRDADPFKPVTVPQWHGAPSARPGDGRGLAPTNTRRITMPLLVGALPVGLTVLIRGLGSITLIRLLLLHL